jgi:acyl-CoA thioester hydrolase
MTAGAMQRDARPQPPRRSAFVWWTAEKLRNADTDQFVHVNNAVLCSFFEAGRMEVFYDDSVRPLTDGASPAIVRLEVDFLREVRFPGRVDLGTRLVNVGTASIRFAQGLFVGDDCVASAQAVCVLLQPGSHRAQQLSERLRRHLLACSEREAA